MRTLQVNLLLQAIVLLTAPLVLVSAGGLLFFAALAGFNYGGILVLYASSAARTWGSENVGQVYGWLFSANIPAAAAPIVACVAFDRLGSFAPVLWGIGGLMACGALALGLGVRLKDRKEMNVLSNQIVGGSGTQNN